MSPYRSDQPPGGDGFGQLLRAEWTKFRTVRGWAIGLVVAVLLTVLVGLVAHGTCSTGSADGGPSHGCSLPEGPAGTPVLDNYYFVHQPLTGDGTITVRVASLTGRYVASNPDAELKSGLEPWAKAGILIKENTRSGSTYAAVMRTGGHGVRMQYDYTHDVAGSAAPRWLRLTRSGDTLTGAESVDGRSWTTVGSTRLTGLSTTVQAGLFVASPQHAEVISQSIGGTAGYRGPSWATATFDDVGVRGSVPGKWTSEAIGESELMPGADVGSRQSGDGFVVTGSGDIAPAVASGAAIGTTITETLLGTFVGLIAVIVVATIFITAEYRRGLIRVSLAASPRRGRVLAAKAIVIGAVTFVAGLVASAVTIPIGVRALRASGNYVFPTSTFTDIRVVVGTAALYAVAAVLALAVGTVLRRSAGAVAIVIAVIVLPYFLAITAVVPAGPGDWLLRLTPAAGFALQQTAPQYAQVAHDYTPLNGYYPLGPWAGFAVLCGYTAAALALAAVLLRRRDA